ncbi:MAG: hypothetical protein ABIB71_03475 [Candidatus Woesearchaeota archaeon]
MGERSNSIGYSVVLEVAGDNDTLTNTDGWKFKSYASGNNSRFLGKVARTEIEKQPGMPISVAKDIEDKIKVNDVNGIYLDFFNVVIPVNQYASRAIEFLKKAGESIDNPVNPEELNQKMFRLEQGLKSIFSDYQSK